METSLAEKNKADIITQLHMSDEAVLVTENNEVYVFADGSVAQRNPADNNVVTSASLKEGITVSLEEIEDDFYLEIKTQDNHKKSELGSTFEIFPSGKSRQITPNPHDGVDDFYTHSVEKTNELTMELLGIESFVIVEHLNTIEPPHRPFFRM